MSDKALTLTWLCSSEGDKPLASKPINMIISDCAKYYQENVTGCSGRDGEGSLREIQPILRFKWQEEAIKYCQWREKHSTSKGGPAHVEGRARAKGLSWIRILHDQRAKTTPRWLKQEHCLHLTNVEQRLWPGLALGIEFKVDTSLLWSQVCCFGKVGISYFYFEFWKVKHSKVT